MPKAEGYAQVIAIQTLLGVRRVSNIANIVIKNR